MHVQHAVRVTGARAVHTGRPAAPVRIRQPQMRHHLQPVRPAQPVHTTTQTVTVHVRLAVRVTTARAVQTEILVRQVHIRQRQTRRNFQIAGLVPTVNGRTQAEAALAAITAKPVISVRAV